MEPAEPHCSPPGRAVAAQAGRSPRPAVGGKELVGREPVGKELGLAAAGEAAVVD